MPAARTPTTGSRATPAKGLRRAEGASAQRVTLDDVAQVTGVTKNTVSLALHDRPGSHKISSATRERIRLAAAELGYTPNLQARSLSLSRAGTIGLYCGRSFWMVTPWSAHVFSGLQRGSADHQLDLLLHGRIVTGADGGQHYLYGAANGKVDGLIVLAEPGDGEVAQLKRSGLPLVSLATAFPGIPSVLDDGAANMRVLARHLHGRGHRRVLFRDLQATISERCRGFCAEAKALGMRVTVRAHDYLHPEGFTAEEEALLDLDRSDRCTALVGGADSTVAPALAECHRRGWRVPEDLAVAGYDGLVIQHELPPRWTLTTIRIDWWQAAEVAVRQLVDLIAGKEVPARTWIPGVLVIGDSA